MEANNNITIDPKKLDIVDISTVRANTWNPKDKDTKEFNDIKKSIEVNGLMGFIVVRNNPVGESLYEIIDGEQRYTACVELGFTKICIYNEGTLEDKKARELTIWWQAQVPFNELSLAKLVSNMIEEYGSLETYFTEKKLQEMQEMAKFNFSQYQKAPQMPPPPTATLLKTFSIQLTEQQYDELHNAIARASQMKSIDGYTEAEALTAVATFYVNNYGLPEAEVTKSNIEEDLSDKTTLTDE